MEKKKTGMMKYQVNNKIYSNNAISTIRTGEIDALNGTAPVDDDQASIEFCSKLLPCPYQKSQYNLLQQCCTLIWVAMIKCEHPCLDFIHQLNIQLEQWECAKVENVLSK